MGDFWQTILIACIPSFIAVCLIIAFVKDKKSVSNASSTVEITPTKRLRYRKITLSDIKGLGAEYWILIGVACTYMVSKVTESIVILYVVTTLGLPKYLAPICMIIYQLGNSFVALPAGIISDKINIV